MNRLATWQKTTTLSMEPLQYHQGDAPQARTCEKAIFVPLKYEPKHAYPLLVWLHDNGQAESSLRDIMPMISLRNFLAVAPRGMANLPTPAAASHADCQSLASGANCAAGAWSQTADGILAAEDAIESCIQAVSSRYHVATSHVFVAGWGSGGTMALRLAFRNSSRFAGCASLGGAFPATLCPLQDINRARGLNVLLARTDATSEYDTDQFCHDVRLMYLAGSRLHVRHYQGDHEVRKVILNDVNRWLMSVVTDQDLFQTTDVPFRRPDLN